MSKNLVLLPLLVLLSCGGKPKSGNLEIQIGALSATSPTMLYGVRTDGSERWGKKLTEEKTTIALSAGEWKLQAINWTNSGGFMEGTPTCAAQVVTIGGNQAQVDLSLSTESCKGEYWYNGTGFSSTGSTTYFGSFNANICPVGVSEAELNSQTDCSHPLSTVSGFRISLPEFKNGDLSSATAHVSQCYPVSGNAISSPLKLPFGSDRTFPMFTKLELFHAPEANCSGEACCAGPTAAYHFPAGLGQATGQRTAVFKEQSFVRLKLEEKSSQGLKVHHPLVANYRSCQPISITHQNAQNVSEAVLSATRVGLECENCSYHVASNCDDTPVSQVTIDAGADTANLFVHVEGHFSKLRARSLDSSLSPAIGRIRGLATYAQIDHQYLFSAPISEIGIGSVTPPFVMNDLIVFETRSMNRGKMMVKNLMNINLPGDKIQFDFVTYDSFGGIVTQESDIWVTACSNADCNIDFDSYPAVGGNTPPQTDIWFQNYGSGIGWFTQSTTFNFLR